MSATPNLIHPTYRYLDRAIRLAGLTLSQWAQLVGAGVGAWVLARVLPFSGTYDLSVGIAVAGVPVAASLAAGPEAVHPLFQARAVIAWRRRAHVHLPGVDPDAEVLGYRLTSDRPAAPESRALSLANVEDLWA